MQKNIIEHIVGILVISLAVLCVFMAYRSGATNQISGPVQTLYARFDRVEGVVTGSNVTVSGIAIGKVAKIELDPKSYRALVSMVLRQDIHLPKDSYAEITGNLLGDKHIAIVPGADEEYIPDSGYIEKTQSSISLESLIGKFMFNDQKNNHQTQ